MEVAPSMRQPRTLGWPDWTRPLGLSASGRPLAAPDSHNWFGRKLAGCCDLQHS